MTIKQYFFINQLTDEQQKLAAEIEVALTTIMTNPTGTRFDTLDVKHHKSLIKSFSDRFTKLFTLGNGFYSYQAASYHIQTYLENKYRKPVTGVFRFELTPDIFKDTFLREIGIHTYNGGVKLYPIQIRVMTIWLCLCYFDIRLFKLNDFDAVFAMVDECLDEDMKAIEDIWAEIKTWHDKHIDEILEAQKENTEYRSIKRKARRVLSDRLMTKELELHHFMAQSLFTHTYSAFIDCVAKKYHLTRRSILKRAKEIGLTDELYYSLRDDICDFQVEVWNEIDYYADIIKNGPYDKSTRKQKYLKQFCRYREFWSPICDSAGCHVEDAEDFDETFVPEQVVDSGQPEILWPKQQPFADKIDCFKYFTPESRPVKNVYSSLSELDCASESDTDSTSINVEPVDLSETTHDTDQALSEVGTQSEYKDTCEIVVIDGVLQMVDIPGDAEDEKPVANYLAIDDEMVDMILNSGSDILS